MNYRYFWVEEKVENKNALTPHEIDEINFEVPYNTESTKWLREELIEIFTERNFDYSFKFKDVNNCEIEISEESNFSIDSVQYLSLTKNIVAKEHFIQTKLI